MTPYQSEWDKHLNVNYKDALKAAHNCCRGKYGGMVALSFHEGGLCVRPL